MEVTGPKSQIHGVTFVPQDYKVRITRITVMMMMVLFQSGGGNRGIWIIQE